MHRSEVDAQVAGVHPREQQQVFDDIGEPESLMNERGDFVARFVRKMIVREQFLEAGAEYGHGRFELVRSVGGKARGALQFFAGQFERGLGAPALRAVFLGVHREFFHGPRKPRREKVAGHDSAEQQHRTRAGGLPAKAPLPREQLGERIDAHFAGRRKERAGVEPLEKKLVRRAIDPHAEAALRDARRRERAGDVGADVGLRVLGERGKMKRAIEPDAAQHSPGRACFSQLGGFEPQHDRRDDIAGFGRNDRHGDDFVDRVAGALLHEIADLLALRHARERELRFGVAAEVADIIRVRRRDDRAISIEETIEPRAQHVRRLIRRRVVLIHDIAHLFAGARVEKIERIVLERGVNARPADERAAAFGERRVANLLHAVQRRERGLEIALQIALGLDRDFFLREIKPERGDRHDHQRHRHEQLRTKARDAGAVRVGRRDHGRSTCSVAPLFSSSAFSSVVFVLSHALSRKLPAGRPPSLKRPSVSVITKCGVSSTRISPRMCS